MWGSLRKFNIKKLLRKAHKFLFNKTNSPHRVAPIALKFPWEAVSLPNLLWNSEYLSVFRIFCISVNRRSSGNGFWREWSCWGFRSKRIFTEEASVKVAFKTVDWHLKTFCFKSRKKEILKEFKFNISSTRIQLTLSLLYLFAVVRWSWPSNIALQAVPGKRLRAQGCTWEQTVREQTVRTARSKPEF